MRAPHDQFITEEEQTSQYADLNERPFSVLPTDPHAYLWRGPHAVLVLTECAIQHVTLPWVRHEPGAGGQFDGFRPGCRDVSRDAGNPRQLLTVARDVQAVQLHSGNLTFAGRDLTREAWRPPVCAAQKKFHT